MTDAPEHIWAVSDRRNHWSVDRPNGDMGLHSVKYTRADLTPAVKPLVWKAMDYPCPVEE